MDTIYHINRAEVMLVQYGDVTAGFYLLKLKKTLTDNGRRNQKSR